MQLFSQSKFGVIRGKGNYKLKDVIKKNILWTLKNVVISEIVVIKGHQNKVELFNINIENKALYNNLLEENEYFKKSIKANMILQTSASLCKGGIFW